jgi:phospholipid/cholesterol/gamma-HCH transport system ATP-binding protein
MNAEAAREEAASENVAGGAEEREVVVAARGIETRIGKNVIHEPLDLTAYRGEVLAIIGTSGGGKTTLLREITGLRKPSAGTVEIFGKDINQLDWRETHELRKRWGIMFQEGALFSALTIFDNVAFPLGELHTMGEGLDSDLVHELVMLKIQMTGLAREDANKLPAELSGGMIKRAALARALAVEAELLFLDEPVSGLDSETARDLDKVLDDLQQELNLSIVMVSHDLDSVAALADRIAILADKRMLFEGSLAELAESEAAEEPEVKKLFEGARGAAMRARMKKSKQ